MAEAAASKLLGCALSRQVIAYCKNAAKVCTLTRMSLDSAAYPVELDFPISLNLSLQDLVVIFRLMTMYCPSNVALDVDSLPTEQRQVYEDLLAESGHKMWEFPQSN